MTSIRWKDESKNAYAKNAVLKQFTYANFALILRYDMQILHISDGVFATLNLRRLRSLLRKPPMTGEKAGKPESQFRRNLPDFVGINCDSIGIPMTIGENQFHVSRPALRELVSRDIIQIQNCKLKSVGMFLAYMC
jgi:hypothetical protein